MDYYLTAEIRTVELSEFEVKCLKLMDEVADKGEAIVITRGGEPVAKLSPYRMKPKSLFGIDRGRLEIIGDIEGPIIEGPIDVEWQLEPA